MPHTNKHLAQRRIKENELSRSCIRSKYLNLEPELQETKWFEYRFISSYQATHKFALAYDKHYKHAFARHFDRSAKPRPLDWTEFGRPSQLMTQLWGARQNADRLGMPYDDYLEFFDEFNMRRARKHLPRPNQIEGSAAAKRVWPAKLAAFESERSWHRLARLDVPQLHVDNFRGHPAQIAFRAWAMEVVRSPGRSFRQAMEQLSFRQRVVPPEAFLSVIEDEIHLDLTERFDADCKRGRIVPQMATALSTVSFWPSCFALVAPNTPTCPNCPFQQDCRKMNDYSHGRPARSSMLSADDLKRKKDRERQARCRMKRKETRVTKS